jgi:hypothetical protein
MAPDIQSTSSGDLPVAPATRPIIGEWNILEVCIGKRGYGKSTYQMARAYELSCEAGGAYVIGHSLGRRLPEYLPPELGLGAVKLPIKYHTTIASVSRGVQTHPNHWHILAPLLPEEDPKAGDPETADDLLRYSVHLSAEVRKRAWRRAHPLRFWSSGQRTLELEAPPIIVVMDEGIAVQAASTGARARGSDTWFLQYIYSLRHYHIALLYSIQEPSARSWRMLEAATAIHVFRSQHQWAINAIEACGATDDEIDQIRALDRFQKVTLR